MAGVGDPEGEVDTLRLEGWSELTVGRARAALPRLLRALAMRQRPRRRSSGRRDPEEPRRGVSSWPATSAAAQGHLWEAATRLAASGEYGEVGWCLGILGFSLLQTGRTAVALRIAQALRSQHAGPGRPVVGVDVRRAGGGLPSGASATSARRPAGAAAALRAFDELDDAWGSAMAQLVRGMAARAVGDIDAGPHACCSTAWPPPNE